MDVHKPKPFHNWREFLAEIATIVIGVLIALSAEQVVQGFEWQGKVARADRAMQLEIAADDGPQVYERLALDTCVDASLERVRSAVESGAGRADVLAAAAAYGVPHHSWDSQSYDAAREEGATLHAAGQHWGWWGLVFAEIRQLDRDAEREFGDGAILGAISRTGGALTADEKARVLLAVETLSRDNRTMVDAARIAQFGMRQAHAGIDPKAAQRELATLQQTPSAAPCIPQFRALLKADRHTAFTAYVPPPVR